MNKKYIDFVPTKKGKAAKKPAAKKPVAKKPVVKKAATMPVLGKSEVKKPEAKKPVVKKPAAKASRTFEVPKPNFINQDKVVKRPLSKNVYRRRVVDTTEVPKGPVTIITKPEKQAHVALIVTILLTIILGAAAGTVAFLLLPK